MAQHASIAVAGGAIEYRLELGSPDVPPLVFLHEGLGSLDLWRGVPDDIRDLVGRPTLLVYSRHGYGRSDPAPLPRATTYMHHEADVVLVELLERLRIREPVLIGHSDGASIALLHAGAGHPVSGVVCIAPHVFVEPESIEGVEAARAEYAAGDLRARLERHHADPEATFRGWNDVWRSEAFRAWNIEDRLWGVDVPVLLVQGTDDRYGTLRQLDAIERGVRGPVERCVVEGAGHSPHFDARGVVVLTIAAFVNSLRKR